MAAAVLFWLGVLIVLSVVTCAVYLCTRAVCFLYTLDLDIEVDRSRRPWFDWPRGQLHPDRPVLYQWWPIRLGWFGASHAVITWSSWPAAGTGWYSNATAMTCGWTVFIGPLMLIFGRTEGATAPSRKVEQPTPTYKQGKEHDVDPQRRIL